ncbi:MAG: hypothetical protein ACTJHC_08635 [Vagococcus sp.]
MTITRLILIEWEWIKKYLIHGLIFSLLTMGAFYLSLPKAAAQQLKGEPILSIGINMPVMDDPSIPLLIRSFKQLDIIKTVDLYHDYTPAQQISTQHDIFIQFPTNLEHILYEQDSGGIDIFFKDPMMRHILEPLINQSVESFIQLQGYSLSYEKALYASHYSAVEKNDLELAFNKQLFSHFFLRHSLLNTPQQVKTDQLIVSSLLVFILAMGISVLLQLIFSDQLHSGLIKKYRLYTISKWYVIMTKLIFLGMICFGGSILLIILSHNLGISLSFFPFMVGFICLTLSISTFLCVLTAISYNKHISFHMIVVNLSFFFIWLLLSGLVYPISSKLTWLSTGNPAYYTQLIIEKSSHMPISYVLPMISALGFSLLCIWGCVKTCSH